jgi:hypothetical protein
MTSAALLLVLFGASPSGSGSVSFYRDVMPVLSKAGCNRGGCHGNANGKGGFKLSLRGQDAGFDYHWLTRESGGRRVDRFNPDVSLFLLKSTSQLSHQGGTRFKPDSVEYRLLRNWVSAGAPPPDPNEAHLVRLDVVPQERFLVAPRDSIQLSVTAIYDNGNRVDVTRMATYEPSNLQVEVDLGGNVTRRSDGEATVIVRYRSEQAAARLAFVPERHDYQWRESTPHNFIDPLIDAKLRQLRIKPSPLSTDNVFVRRAYLDAIGVLPSADESRQFVKDQRPDKRSRLIERLLVRPEFADHWALKWCDILRTEEKVLDPQGVDAFHSWIREAIANATPVDKFVRALLRAEGSTYQNPPTNFWRANRDPATRGETTARLFLGARLQCAKCHNHPFDKWTQDDYYSWAAVFARIDYEIVENERADRLDKNEFKGEQRVVLANKGKVVDPRTGRTVAPKLLGDRRLGPGAYRDRLTPLAVWLTSPDNKTFAQTQVNFVWYHLMGRGLVEPIDDFRSTNPPIHPRLLEALAEHFAERRFDLRHLIRTIMNSRTYQLSAEPNPTNINDHANFSRAIVFRLPAEKLLDAQSVVIGTPADFAGYPHGLRAGQIPGVRRVRRRDMLPQGGDRFLRTFGKPERLLACECERSNETTLAQTFVMIGGNLHNRLASPNNRLAGLADTRIAIDEVIDELYWAALSRPPSRAELDAARRLLSVGVSERPPLSSGEQDWARRLTHLFAKTGWFGMPDDRFARIQDLTWALLNSKEFVFRH